MQFRWNCLRVRRSMSCSSIVCDISVEPIVSTGDPWRCAMLTPHSPNSPSVDRNCPLRGKSCAVHPQLGYHRETRLLEAFVGPYDCVKD